MTILVGLLALVPVLFVAGVFVAAASEDEGAAAIWLLMMLIPMLLWVAYCVGLVVRPWLVEVLR